MVFMRLRKKFLVTLIFLNSLSERKKTNTTLFVILQGKKQLDYNIYFRSRTIFSFVVDKTTVPKDITPSR